MWVSFGSLAAMSPTVVDQTCLWIAALAPIPLIIWRRWIGFVLGALVVWATLIIAGILLSQLDPQRDGGMLDTVWLLFGWIGGAMYCLPILGVREAIAWMIRQRRQHIHPGR